MHILTVIKEMAEKKCLLSIFYY